MDTPNFEGAYNPETHRTCGDRALCSSCGDWCYPADWCDCCHEAAGHVWMDPSRVSVEAIAPIVARAMQTDPGDLTPEVAAAAVVAWINGEDE